MLPWIRRLFDVRAGEGLRVLISFLYVAVVVAAFLLAKPIRNSLFLAQHGPYALVYAYAAVPLVLSLFVPVYSRLTARLGSRIVTIGTLVVFSSNAVMFWFAFHAQRAGEPARGTIGWLLPGMFYVWVNCFGVIAPVQAWTFTSALFDTRQARRLFGVIGAGASVGAIGAGLLARFLVGPVGGTVNMMLVLAALILVAAGLVAIGAVRLRRPGPPGPPRRTAHPFSESLALIGRSPYLRLLSALVFLVAVSTQWTAFQLSLVANARFGGRVDALTEFFGTFNFVLGATALVVQLAVARPLLRRFGAAVAILLLPLMLGAGSAVILLLPMFWPVLVTNALDQGFRFSLDKSAYELLYLPLAPGQRGPVKSTIDIVVSRAADAVGAVLLGCATGGFLMFSGLGLGLRGTAAVNLALIATWIAVASRLRAEYVRTIQDSIHRHRVAAEHDVPDEPGGPAAALAAALATGNAPEIRGALAALEGRATGELRAGLLGLLDHEEAEIRRRALALLAASRDRTIAADATRLLRDPDLNVRTEALLFVTRELGADPIAQLQEMGDFEDFSIRAGLAAFLASPGPSQNLEAARVILEAMARSPGEPGQPDRRQAARVLALAPDAFPDILTALMDDPDEAVAREGVLAAGGGSHAFVPLLLAALSRPELSGNAAASLARHGDPVVSSIDVLLHEPGGSLAVKRELPGVLVRIGTPRALQVLVDGLLQPDAMLRHRVVASVNKLHQAHPEVPIDRQLIELLLAAEIAGHYRSYQVLGPLGARLEADDVTLRALRQTMDQELERIFRLMSLLFAGPGLHDAYVGIRSASPLVRANALEFLDNVLPPDLRRVLVPLLDSQVSIETRIALADRLVGARLETAEQAVATLLGSEDAWLRSCAVYAVGALQLGGLEPELRRFEAASDPVVRDAARAARQRLVGAAEEVSHPAEPPEIQMGVG